MDNKKYRSNNTRPISVDLHENPKLMARLLKNGKESVYLEFYVGNGKRKSKTLKGLFLYTNPSKVEERRHNKDILNTARSIRDREEIEFLEKGEGYSLKKPQDTDFLKFCDDYVARYNKAGKKNTVLALRRFRSFLADTPAYQCYKDSLKAKLITPEMIRDFVDYLRVHGQRTGPKTAYSRFKAMINCGVEKKLFQVSPCKGINLPVDEEQVFKDVLSVDEIKKLLTTHYKNESKETRRAFTFCLFTGIRGCDVRNLTYGNVDYENKVLKFVQSKTKWTTDASSLIIPITEKVLEVIGPPKDKNEHIFKLPTQKACLNTLNIWTQKAGINKHITWHCARHSFAINNLANGVSVVVVSKLLGHTSLKHTMKYLKAVDKMKQEAMNNYLNLF